MSLPINNMEQILTNAASGMSAQTIRMNTIASNLANSGSVGSSEETTYHTQYPIFSEVTKSVSGVNPSDQPIGGVQVTKIDHTHKPLEKRYDPNNPSADSDGYIYVTDVNPIAQMTDMISSSKEYQADVEVMNTAKTLISATLTAINSR